MTFFILLLGVCASSSAAVLIRLCNAPSLVIATYRLGISTSLVLPLAFMGYRNQIWSRSSRDRLSLLGSGIFLGLHFALWITSLSHTSIANSVLLVSTSPIFVGLGGWLILKEPVNSRMALGITIALIGTAILAFSTQGEGRHTLYGDFLALCGALTLSGHLLIGRKQRQNFNLIPYIALTSTVATTVLAFLTSASGYTFIGYNNLTYLLFSLLALGPQLLGHTSINYALKRVSPSLISLILLLEPIGSLLLAYLVLEEIPSPFLFLSATIIITGIALATWKKELSKPKKGSTLEIYF